MQTQYKLLYRYINENTQTPITSESDYDKTEKFIGPDGKLNIKLTNIGNTVEPVTAVTQEQLDLIHQEASQENENLMIENMANEDKANNLFVYTGTTKTYTSKFVPAQYGYLVRDYTMIPKSQIPENRNDFSKHFVLLDGDKPGVGDAKLVCKPQYMKNYFSTITITPSEQFTEISYLTDELNSRTPFTYIDPDNNPPIAQYGETAITKISSTDNVKTQTELNTQDNKNYYAIHDTNYGCYYDRSRGVIVTQTTAINIAKRLLVSYKKVPIEKILTNYIQFTVVKPCSQHGTHNVPVQGVETSTWDTYITDDIQELSKIEVTQDNLIKTIIPEHEEPMGVAPYYIKDNYKKIEMSPWMIHSIHNSLESALQSARKIVSMIGMENVKLIKYVPIDQFVKLK